MKPTIASFSQGDTISLKKKHACGGSRWKILYLGADVKLKCLQCGRLIVLERAAFEKNAKKVITLDE